MIKRFTFSVLALLAAFVSQAQNPAPCSKPFFSEYVEGSNNNKAIEVYNPTTGTVDLTQYKVWISYNGGTSTTSITLQGTLDPGETFVLANTAAVTEVLDSADQTSASLDFNGNDAVALIELVTGDTLDVIGVIGEDPAGGSWTTSSGDATVDYTLVRDAIINNGDLDWTTGQDGWFGTGLNVFFGLGNHFMQPCGIISDPEVGFAVSSQTAGEAFFDIDAMLTITYPNDSPTTVTIGLLPGGTATSGADFALTSTTVTFPANSSVPVPFNVTINEDLLTETTEFFVLQIQSVTNNAIIVQDIDTIFIEDNEGQGVPPNLYLSPAVLTAVENGGVAGVQVQIGGANNNATTVELTIVPSGTTATAGVDFTFASPVIATFPPADNSSQIVLIPMIDDLLAEGNETIKLQLTNPTNDATINPAADTVLITIIDNEPTGIAQLSQFGIAAWPNPVSDRCNVTANALVERCDVINAAGQLVLRSEPMAERFAINMTTLPSGVYMIEAITAERALHYRLVKK